LWALFGKNTLSLLLEIGLLFLESFKCAGTSEDNQSKYKWFKWKLDIQAFLHIGWKSRNLEKFGKFLYAQKRLSRICQIAFKWRYCYVVCVRPSWHS